jgi:Rhodopirellula transposase DDE domain
VTRACRGVIFETAETAKWFMEKAETATGLKVVVRFLDKVYATGRKCAGDCKKTRQIVFDAVLPKWNYTAVPQAN